MIVLIVLTVQKLARGRPVSITASYLTILPQNDGAVTGHRPTHINSQRGVCAEAATSCYVEGDFVRRGNIVGSTVIVLGVLVVV